MPNAGLASNGPGMIRVWPLMPMKVLVAPYFASISSTVVAVAVVLMALPQELRPSLWWLLLALPLVAAGSMYMYARVQLLKRAATQLAPPGSAQYLAAVIAITAITCVAACVLAVMPTVMHVPVWGDQHWSAVATGAILWALLAAPLLIFALASMHKACAQAHVLQTAGSARAALLGCRVSELEDLKRQLLLSFTHELNTPLHEVMGCLDALMSATGSNSLPGTSWPLAHTAHSSANRAARLVKSITDAVQIQHKKLDVNRTRVSLVSIVQMLQAVDWGPPASHVAQSDHAESVTSDRSNVSASLESSRADANGSRATSESHALMNGSRTSSATGGVAGNAPTGAGDGEITLEKLTAGLGAATWGMGHQRQLLVHVAPEAEYVHADGDRLLQVLYELVSNGFKFSAGAVELQATVSKGNVVISVKDNGCGIPADELERVWGPFHQVYGHNQRGAGRSGDGLGLGLYLVDQILRGHGVAPRCESRPGQGTCVSFQMPLAESHAQSQASAVAQPVDDTSPASAAVAAQSHTADMLFCGATSGAATVLCPGEQDKDSSLGAWDPQARLQHNPNAAQSEGAELEAKNSFRALTPPPQRSTTPSPQLSTRSLQNVTPELTASLAAAVSQSHCSLSPVPLPEPACSHTASDALPSAACANQALERRILSAAPMHTPPVVSSNTTTHSKAHAASQAVVKRIRNSGENFLFAEEHRVSEASEHSSLRGLVRPSSPTLIPGYGAGAVEHGACVPFCALLPFSPRSCPSKQLRHSSFGSLTGVQENEPLFEHESGSVTHSPSKLPTCNTLLPISCTEPPVRFLGSADTMKSCQRKVSDTIRTDAHCAALDRLISPSIEPECITSDSMRPKGAPQRSMSSPDALLMRQQAKISCSVANQDKAGKEVTCSGSPHIAASKPLLKHPASLQCMCGGSCNQLPADLASTSAWPGAAPHKGYWGDAKTDEEAKALIHQAFFESLGFQTAASCAGGTVTEAADTCVNSSGTQPVQTLSSDRSQTQDTTNAQLCCTADHSSQGRSYVPPVAHCGEVHRPPQSPPTSSTASSRVFDRWDSAMRVSVVAQPPVHVHQAHAYADNVPLALPSLAPVISARAAAQVAPAARRGSCGHTAPVQELSEAAWKLSEPCERATSLSDMTEPSRPAHDHTQSSDANGIGTDAHDQDCSVADGCRSFSQACAQVQESQTMPSPRFRTPRASPAHVEESRKQAHCTDGAVVSGSSMQNSEMHRTSSPAHAGARDTGSSELLAVDVPANVATKCSDGSSGCRQPNPGNPSTAQQSAGVEICTAADGEGASAAACERAEPGMTQKPYISASAGDVCAQDTQVDPTCEAIGKPHCRRRGVSLDLALMWRRRRLFAKARSSLDASGTSGASAAGRPPRVARSEAAAGSTMDARQGDILPTNFLHYDCEEESLRHAPRIMVVDDNAVNQLVLSRMLQSVGMEVVVAMSGAEALQKLADPSDDLPDLLIMDVMMPGLSGLDLCREVRRHYPDSMLPAIFVSSNSRPEHIVDGLSAGAQDYMTKPVNKSELIARVQSQLNSSRTIERAAVDLAEHLLERQLHGDVKSDSHTMLSSY